MGPFYRPSPYGRCTFKPAVGAAIFWPVVCPEVLRFVRHLPVRRHGAARGVGLRAGVGQTSGEETAGRTTVLRKSLRLYGDSGAVAQSEVDWTCA